MCFDSDSIPIQPAGSRFVHPIRSALNVICMPLFAERFIGNQLSTYFETQIYFDRKINNRKFRLLKTASACKPFDGKGLKRLPRANGNIHIQPTGGFEIFYGQYIVSSLACRYPRTNRPPLKIVLLRIVFFICLCLRWPFLYMKNF